MPHSTDGGPPSGKPAASTTQGHSGERHPSADARRQARERIQLMERRRRIAGQLDQLLPLAAYYRHPRPGWYCPIVEGWRAA
jgi:hypothetical protein